ncbi:MAG: hypothetical protein HY466_00240 [Deltaproteobacteria bacterium]|nr:hypothetical protein [Deltaproteobacteria bacterium]
MVNRTVDSGPWTMDLKKRSKRSTVHGPRSMVLLFASLLLCTSLACTKTYRTARPEMPKVYKKTFAANPNAVYYALRWALPAQGYPIADEDLHNGIIKTRYVPVGAVSHALPLFGRNDYGVNGAYHQLEVRLVPQGGRTEVQVGSRIQAVVSPLRSTGREEARLFDKIGDYLRDRNAALTNQGIQE